AWRSRRHVPFFGVATLAYTGPYLVATLQRLRAMTLRRRSRSVTSESDSGMPLPGNVFAQSNTRPLALQMNSDSKVPLRAAVAAYLVLFFYAASVWLPQASFQVLAPIGDDPVREAD